MSLINSSEVSNVRDALDWLFNKIKTLMAKDIKINHANFPDNETIEDALDLLSTSKVNTSAFDETVSLLNVDITTLSSGLTQTNVKLENKVNQDILGQPNGVAMLDENGMVHIEQLPPTQPSTVFPAIEWYDLPLLNGAVSRLNYEMKYGKVGTIGFVAGIVIPNNEGKNLHIATLPVGFRTRKMLFFACPPEVSTVAGRNISIATSGEIHIQNPFGGGTVSSTDHIDITVSFPI